MKYKHPTSHKLYGSFKKMKSRCYCTSDDSYVGPNIKMCDEWIGNYDAFYEWAIVYWFQDSVLSRIDETMDYSPLNCIFIHKREALVKGQIASCKAVVKKYGCHFSKTEEYRNKVRATNILRFGTSYAMESDIIKAKIAATNMRKYGVKSTLSLSNIQDKIKQTNIDKYGYETATSNPEIYKKVTATNISRYGVSSVMKCERFKQKSRETCIAKYGVPHYNRAKLISQNQVYDYIVSITNKPFGSDYNILSGKEIDIYNDELKFGIEYCGLYWHSEHRSGTRTSHSFKYNECTKAGVRLITIFEDEWINRQSQVKNFIKASLGICDKKIMARKCLLKEVEREEAAKFIESHHIQGAGKTSLVYFGLYDTDGLVGVISLGRHHRNNDGSVIVLDRLCYKDGINITGGSSRLFKKCVEWAKEKGYKSILSWSDNRWSIGTIYGHLGFKLDAEMSPDYSYVHGINAKERVSKQSCQKKYINCSAGQTEYDRMKKLGYARIWDCGKRRWVFNLS